MELLLTGLLCPWLGQPSGHQETNPAPQALLTPPQLQGAPRDTQHLSPLHSPGRTGGGSRKSQQDHREIPNSSKEMKHKNFLAKLKYLSGKLGFYYDRLLLCLMGIVVSHSRPFSMD